MAVSLIGQTLGKYKIVELIGRGGMAAVYKGYQQDVDRYVAVKVLSPHPAQDEQFVQRFRLEARTIARLQHPHILPLYDYGDQDDILYLVMPWLEGGSLAERIRDVGPLSLAETERILRQVASALDYAHRQGMIHRDIKPDNILLSAEGDALLSDFGIVKLIEGGTGLTGTGGMVGTPAYMAPEQAHGEPIGPAADIYALGVVVYEMLTGVQPYSADTPVQMLLKHISEPVPKIGSILEGVPVAVDLVMQRVLAKEPEARYPTAGEFAVAFAKAITGLGIETVGEPQRRAAVAAQPTPQAGSTVAENQTVIPVSRGMNVLYLVVGAAVLALLVAGLALLVVLNREPVVVVADATETPLVLPSSTASEAQVGVTTPAATDLPTFGTVSFGTASGPGDTVNLRVEGLEPPPDGEAYFAWLYRSNDASVWPLGQIPVDAFGNGVLSATDPDGRMLPALYNAVLITRESQDAPLEDGPSTEAVYSGYAPSELTAALSEILVSSETGRPGTSLLEDAIAEAELAQRHAGLASGATSINGRHTHAEHTVNILLGTEDDLNGDGRPENPGLGFGLPYFLDRIDRELNSVAELTSSSTLQGDGEVIRVCVINVRQWVDEVVALEREMLASDDFDAVSAQAVASTQLAAAVLDGVDLNGNGQVEPFEGECGLRQIADYGLAVENMTIVAGPPPF